MSVDEMRGLSTTIFGHRYRLELVAALAITAADEGVCLTLLAHCCQVLSSVYYPSLKMLVAAGLVRRMGRTRTDRRVLYGRASVPVWTGLGRMVEAFEVEIDLREAVRTRGARN
jgi:hypothetical protein